MKATNIYQSLRSKGVCGTDGIPPKLPGVSSPYKFNTGLKEAAAKGELDDNQDFKSAVESSPAIMKGNPKKDSKKVKAIKAGVDKAASELHGGHMLKSAHYNEFFTRDSDGVRLSDKIYKKNPEKSAYYKAVDNSLTSTVRNLEHKRQEKVGVPKTKDKPYGEFRTHTRPKDQFNWRAGKTTYTGRGYGSEPENKKRTADYESYKAATSPAKKKGCKYKK